MIQRIQSVYLLLAIIPLGLMFYFPLAIYIGGDKDQLVYYIYQLVSEIPGNIPDVPSYFIYPILVLNLLSVIMIVSTIFRFRSLGSQIKMVRAAILLILVMVAVFFFYSSPLLEEASGTLTEYEIGAYMPPVALLFLILAYRGIMSDIKLLRSAERLR